MRTSPDVRMTRSGSGISGAYRCARTASSSMAAGAVPASTSALTAATISSREP